MRKNQIQDRINEYRSRSVKDLSDYFGVCVETIRRDLKILELEGRIKRIRGGAISVSDNAIVDSFNKRKKSNLDQKKNLVSKAVELISPGMIISLDASSSSWCLAMVMRNIECTVITNSLNVINALKGKTKIKVICIGGEWSEEYEAFYGLYAINSLKQFRTDIAFFSCSSFSYGTGIWDTNERNILIKRAIIDASEHSVLIADASKSGVQGMLKICDIEDVDLILCDASSSISNKLKINAKESLCETIT